MTLRGSLHRGLRGPLRARLRHIQARAPWTAVGRRPGPPDYVGVGVQRCGTSWWQSLIEQHPDVASLGLGAKELHFFDSFWAREVGTEDIERYCAHFLRRPGYCVGEWTPRYLYDPWAVPALLRAAPQARLLVLLRDPVQRFQSGLRHAAQRTGTLSADDVTAAFGRGLYGAQLGRLLEHVPRRQVLVLQFERCCRDTPAMLAETFDFLSLEPAEVAAQVSVNASSVQLEIARSVAAEVRERYVDDVKELAALFPDRIDLSLWPNFCSL
ncbi:MAG: hypothetical protein DLM57_18480 [Pseudonocardiales bacterium]|nr:MAG: hypothetical protein DLM57_18480 [Pseudonocardiales bacterium]